MPGVPVTSTLLFIPSFLPVLAVSVGADPCSESRGPYRFVIGFISIWSLPPAMMRFVQIACGVSFPTRRLLLI